MTDPTPKRRWFQFSLRTLLVVVTLFCVGMSWFAVRMQKARKQRDTVVAIEKSGGWVRYDCDYDGAGQLIQNAAPPYPAWVCKYLGEDFVATVIEAAVTNDEGLKCVEDLPRLRSLQIGRGSYGEEEEFAFVRRHSIHLEPTDLFDLHVSAAALKHIEGLTQLRELKIFHVPLTDAYLEQVQHLPNLQKLRLQPNPGMKREGYEERVRKLQQAMPNCKLDWDWPIPQH